MEAAKSCVGIVGIIQLPRRTCLFLDFFYSLFQQLDKARYIKHKKYFAIVVGLLPGVPARWEVVLHGSRGQIKNNAFPFKQAISKYICNIADELCI